MYLTAEIDRRLSEKHRRYMGTRTTSFLQSVLQFAGLRDILVGGSQNLIACGVWTLVRTSLLVSVLCCVVIHLRLNETIILRQADLLPRDAKPDFAR